ncbi:transcriptional regulator, LuxR family [Thermobaculum terrenum ATCC BAA-798]|uniref:Transcriptional regulator, LuxR family n=1 Tax=Thermobaculum terrenum (strain ATCC BAA-798 / CCMEE 7001 / YNP1) TaxID=525904 RepID=D1CHW9_THET1|nr:response regulator transcription factor [Thermobaculum terrenum]ACZ43340.1 transcriptional regulator, LuxR family [Thermobaculum terrenum ATCC BAA-798]
MIRVGLVSPYPALRAGLRAMLSGQPEVEVVAEGEDPGAVASAGVDVLLLDAPEGGHPPGVEQGLIILGDRLEADLLGSGHPVGFLPRDASVEEVIAAVRAVASGLSVVAPTLAARIVRREPEEVPLTQREVEVLALMADGLPNKAIAARLGISEHTVKFHVGSILAKLGASSRAEAVAIAARKGLLFL